jgi:hypothetical protein
MNHRPAPTLTRAVTAPSLQHRPSSASSSRSAARAAASLRHRISEIKSKAALVSQSTLRGDIVVEPDDPVRDALLLDRDSKLAVGKACQAREAEMIDIVEGRRRRWNDERRAADHKQAILARMEFELEALQTGNDPAAQSAAALQWEVMAARRIEECNAEFEAAESAMLEATDYSASLRMIAERIVRAINERRKELHELERTKRDLTTQLSNVTGHMRTLQASERVAAEGCQQLFSQMRSRRQVRIDQLERRETMARALSQGGGPGGVDLVEMIAAKIKAQQQELVRMAGQQHALRWSLDSSKDAAHKVHTAADAPAAAAAGSLEAAPAPAKAAVARKASTGQPTSLTGKLPDEISLLKDGPFARYMQRVHTRAGVSDGLLVLRRLHHFLRTEASGHASENQARAHHDRLLKQHAAARAELDRVLRTRFDEVEPEGSTDGGAPGASAHLGVGELDELQAASIAAKSRANDASLKLERSARLISDAYAALGNLSDSLQRTAVPELARDARQEPTKTATRAHAGGASPEIGVSADGSDDAERTATAAGSSDPLDGIASELPARIRLCEAALSRLLAHTNAYATAELVHAASKVRRPPLGVRLGLPMTAEGASGSPHSSGQSPSGSRSGRQSPSSQVDVEEEATADEACVHQTTHRRRRRGASAPQPKVALDDPWALPRKAPPPPPPAVLDREALKRESEKLFEKSEREHLAALVAARAQGRRRS